MVLRMAHKLRAGKRTEAPRRFLFVDTETLPKQIDPKTQELVFRLGVACYWERARQRNRERITWHDLHTQDDFWSLLDRLSEPKEGICLVAHNVGFDLQALGGFHRLGIEGWVIRKAIIDDPPFIVKARRQLSTLLILDWYNYFRGSLAQAGDLLGVPKMPMPAFSESEATWFTYCRNDVRVLLEAMKRYVAFIHTYDLGTFSHTLAGQAFNAYTHRFMETDLFIHTRKGAITLERAGYYGGRVEMYRNRRLPTRTYFYVDINSAYPAVMRANPYPTKMVDIQDDVPTVTLRKRLETHLALADVVVKTDTPLFPYRDEGRLVFPIGTFNTTLATPELLIALERGVLRSVRRACFYERAPIFTRFVDTIYELRKDAKKKGDALWDELLKRMMNSLYGKFGQHNYDWNTVGHNDNGPDAIWREFDRDTGRLHTYRRIAGILQERTKKDEAFNSFVAIAAHATSYARTLLLAYIENAGWRHTYYCDTDSLIVDAAGLAGLRPFIHPTKLGMLKLEKQAKSVTLLAPKNYRFGQDVRHKGRKKDAVQLPGGRYEQEQFVSLTGALRHEWQGGPLVRKVVKRDRLTYRKGIVMDDGRIIPLSLFTP